MFIFIKNEYLRHVLLLLSIQTATTEAVNASATKASTTTTAPGTRDTAVNEELAAKDTNTKTESTPVKSLQGTTTKVKEPIGKHTMETIQTTATVTAATTTQVKEEGLSSVDVKTSEATDHGMEKEHMDDSKEDKIHSDKATCIEG